MEMPSIHPAASAGRNQDKLDLNGTIALTAVLIGAAAPSFAQSQLAASAGLTPEEARGLSLTEIAAAKALAEGPFGVELRRLLPVTTPDGEQGYQPSRMWVVEGPRWAVGELLQALISRDTPGAVITVDEHFGPSTGAFTDFSTH